MRGDAEGSRRRGPRGAPHRHVVKGKDVGCLSEKDTRRLNYPNVQQVDCSIDRSFNRSIVVPQFPPRPAPRPPAPPAGAAGAPGAPPVRPPRPPPPPPRAAATVISRSTGRCAGPGDGAEQHALHVRQRDVRVGVRLHPHERAIRPAAAGLLNRALVGPHLRHVFAHMSGPLPRARRVRNLGRGQHLDGRWGTLAQVIR